MNPYSLLVSLHVISAILGLGPLFALTLVASSSSPAVPVAWLSRLSRVVIYGLGAMLVTGFLVIAQTHGAMARGGWVRVALGLFLVLCALQGLVSRRLRRARDGAPDQLPPGLGRLLWPMCGLVAAITWLMEAKPF